MVAKVEDSERSYRMEKSCEAQAFDSMRERTGDRSTKRLNVSMLIHSVGFFSILCVCAERESAQTNRPWQKHMKH